MPSTSLEVMAWVFLAPQTVGKSLGEGQVFATDSEVAWAVEGDLLGMARARHDQGARHRRAEHARHIVGDELVGIRHYTLDSRHYVLARDIDRDFVDMVFEIRRGHDEQQRVGLVADIVYVAREVDAADIKVDVGEVCRVVAQAFEILDAVVAPHIPGYRLAALQQQFGECCRPTAAAHHGDMSRKTCIHDSLFLVRLTRLSQLQPKPLRHRPSDWQGRVYFSCCNRKGLGIVCWGSSGRVQPRW